MQPPCLFSFFFICVCIVNIVSSCENGQITYGCRIFDRECLCGIGCNMRYRYKTQELCLEALKGRSKDSCSLSPCKNGGLCTQKSDERGFVCHCTGTGYHGKFCEEKCPNYSQISRQGVPINFPVDCIEI